MPPAKGFRHWRSLIAVLVIPALVSVALEGMAAWNWGQTTGSVVTAAVRSRRTGSSRHRFSHVPEVVYHYTAAGRSYSGTGVPGRFSPTFFERRVQDWIRDHPPGAPIEVYYRRSDPSRSSLELVDPNVSTAVTTVAVLLTLLFTLRKRPRPCPPAPEA